MSPDEKHTAQHFKKKKVHTSYVTDNNLYKNNIIIERCYCRWISAGQIECAWDKHQVKKGIKHLAHKIKA